MKRGRFVYKNEECMKKMHDFYDKTLALLDVQYTEEYFETSFGKTHCLTVGDSDKPKLCTIHGGNGITTLNLKLFAPLLSDYCIIKVFINLVLVRPVQGIFIFIKVISGDDSECFSTRSSGFNV